MVGNTAYAGSPAALALSPPKAPSLSITYGLISTLYSEPGTVLERSDPWMMDSLPPAAQAIRLSAPTAAELKGRNAPPPTNKKATPQGGFLISSACGDHDQAAWTGVLWSKEYFTWHRPIFSGGYPPNIVGAASFHSRVRDGSEWFQCAMDTRIEVDLL